MGSDIIAYLGCEIELDGEIKKSCFFVLKDNYQKFYTKIVSGILLRSRFRLAIRVSISPSPIISM